VSTLFISFGSFINFSRAAILGLLVTLSTCYAKRKVLLIMFALAVIAIPMVMILSDMIMSILSSGAVQQRTDAATMTQRWGLYNHVLGMIYDRPLSGIGYGNFVRVYGGGTHNSFLQVMVETGLIGIILFIMFVTSLSTANLKESYRLGDSVEMRARLGIIFIVFFVSNTITLLHSPHFLTTLMIILGSINAYYASDTKSDEDTVVRDDKEVESDYRILRMKNEN
jgi:O-antigen ligase